MLSLLSFSLHLLAFGEKQLDICRNLKKKLKDIYMILVSEIADSNVREVEDLEWYGFDPYGPM